MADVSAPSLILFIASLVVAAGVAGVLIDTVNGISSAIDDRGGDVTESIRTDVTVISDSGAGIYDDSEGTLTLLVKNTGLRELPATNRTFDVIVDAEYRTNVSVRVVDGETWRPHRVVELTIGDLALGGGDHRAKLVVDGDEEVFRFHV